VGKQFFCLSVMGQTPAFHKNVYVLFSQRSLGFGERRLSYRPRCTCYILMVLNVIEKKLAVLYVQLCMLLSNGSFFITVLTEMAWSVLRIMVLTGYVHLLQLNYEDCTNSTVCTAYWDRNCKRIQKRSVERILPPPVLLSFFYYYGSCYAK